MTARSVASLSALAFISGLFSPVAIANQYDFPSLHTNGHSEVIAKADMAEVNVSVSTEAKTAQEAKEQSDIAVAKLITRLTDAGIQDQHIQSANIRLNPQYHYPKNQPREQVGYQATRKMTITVMDLANLNSILDSALIEGMNHINNIHLKSSKEDEIKQQARAQAIKDAQQKANSLAAGFGTTVAGVWSIRYQDYQVRPVQYQMQRMEASAADVSKSYQQDNITISDSVEVVFKLNESTLNNTNRNK